MYVHVPDMCFECRTKFWKTLYLIILHEKFPAEELRIDNLSMNYLSITPPPSRSPLAASLGAGFVINLVLGNVCPHSQTELSLLGREHISVICRGPQQVL